MGLSLVGRDVRRRRMSVGNCWTRIFDFFFASLSPLLFRKMKTELFFGLSSDYSILFLEVCVSVWRGGGVFIGSALVCFPLDS